MKRFESWPDIAVITPGRATRAVDLYPRIELLAGRGMRMLVIREPRLRVQEHHELCARLEKNKLSLVVVEHWKSPGARVARAGSSGRIVHLPSTLQQPPPTQFEIEQFGVSCHSLEGLSLAADAGASYLFISPVWAPSSKPLDSRPTLGPDGYTSAKSHVSCPVFALGGVTSTRLRSLGGMTMKVAVMGTLFGPVWSTAREHWDALTREMKALDSEFGSR